MIHKPEQKLKNLRELKNLTQDHMALIPKLNRGNATYHQSLE